MEIPCLLTANIPSKNIKEQYPYFERTIPGEFNYSDQFIFLFEPDYYGIKEDEEGNNLENTLIASYEKSPLFKEAEFTFAIARE